MKDFLGVEIKNGDYIIYPGRRGSNLWMNVGVAEIDENNQLYSWRVLEPVTDPQWYKDIENADPNWNTNSRDVTKWPKQYYLPLKIKRFSVHNLLNCVVVYGLNKVHHREEDVAEKMMDLLVNKQMELKNETST